MNREAPQAPRFVNALCVLCIVVGLGSLAACGGGSQVEIRRSERPPVADMGLGASDVFDVRVFGEPDLSSTYRVAGDGTIDFPLIGRLQARGRTPTQLADEIQTKLQKYVKRPQVSVLLKEANSKKVTIYGQVQHPGTLNYGDQMTISQAISMAGGLTSMAARDSTLVTRLRAGKTETTKVNLKAIANGTETYYLLPGDEVFVPERIF